MARIPLLSVETMTAPQRAQYDRFPSNLSRALLLTDQRLAAALPEIANALRAGSLDPVLREAAILRVAVLHGSAYERMQHLAQAKKVGLTEADIASIESGEPWRVRRDLTAGLAFVDACVASPRVPDVIFEAARSALPPGSLVALILLVGHYMTVARLLGTLDVELDPQPDSWSGEH